MLKEALKEENHPFDETIEGLIAKVSSSYLPKNMDFLRRVYEFSEKAHQGQYRRSGHPYISHPLGVASILVDLKLDIASIASGLLHDTVEDTSVSLADIRENFGPVVEKLVDGVTKISQIQFRHTHEKQGENIRKMILAMGQDVRVILIKLADRLHNMMTLKSMPYEKQARIGQETLDIYAPLAGRLGISEVKVALEDLSFRYTQPNIYYELVQKIDKKKKERDKYITKVKLIITKKLEATSIRKADIQGRPKHLYSIYKKMQARSVDYEEIYDILAFRLCVNSIPECYEILGLIHSLWKPIPGRFKDFIAMPKTNNYQSLHTTVIGPEAERIEIQIRTTEMHLIAERGIAAHWKYKEDSRGGNTVNLDPAKFNWYRDLVESQKNSNSDEFLENIKTDLIHSEIYVFTPQGDVQELPEGSSPVDFAFAVHTDVGKRIVAAKVNGRLVPLKHRLRNGDTVDVITSKNQQPSKDWLNFCVTSRAKSRIRSHVKIEQRKRAEQMGQELLERTFRKAGANVHKHLSGPIYEQFVKNHGINNPSEVFIRVGYGKLTPKQVLEILLPTHGNTETQSQEEENQSFLQKAFRAATKRKKESSSIINVDGMSDLLVRYAKCCHPIPGDPIVGFITRGRGIAIHRADCEKSFALDQDRKIDVEWNQKKSVKDPRLVRIRVVCHDITGLLKLMTEVFVSLGVDIHNAQAKTTRDTKGICLFDVAVQDTAQLQIIMQSLQKIKGVIGVTRMTNT